jgi:glycosyltransferase involved in cell wall biosynthesis
MQHPRNDESIFQQFFVSNVDYDDHSLANIVKASSRLLYSVEAKRKIGNLLKRKPDIVHLNNIYHQISPSIISAIKNAKVPIVMTLHDFKMVCPSYAMLANDGICEACKNGRYYNCLLSGCLKNSRLKSLLGTIEMYLHHKVLKLYDLVDIFISPSKFVKDKLAEMGFRGKIIYLPNFVNIEKFQPQYSWSEDTIVYFGRLQKDKGLKTLIDAVRGIEGMSLKIIGEGPIKDELCKKIKTENIRNVQLLGYMTGEKLHNSIRQAMFVVLCSELYENNPLSAIESFALGKPAVGSRIGGIPELVKDNETGLTFEAGNSQDLRDKIKCLAGKPSLIKAMGQNARRFVESKLNAENYYSNLIDIYDSAKRQSNFKN